MTERIGALIVFSGFGFLTIMPNIMISDSGTKEAIMASSIGMCASGAFILSGITGFLHNKYIPFKVSSRLLITGGILQLSAFAYGFMFCK